MAQVLNITSQSSDDSLYCKQITQAEQVNQQNILLKGLKKNIDHIKHELAQQDSETSQDDIMVMLKKYLCVDNTTYFNTETSFYDVIINNLTVNRVDKKTLEQNMQNTLNREKSVHDEYLKIPALLDFSIPDENNTSVILNTKDILSESFLEEAIRELEIAIADIRTIACQKSTGVQIKAEELLNGKIENIQNIQDGVLELCEANIATFNKQSAILLRSDTFKIMDIFNKIFCSSLDINTQIEDTQGQTKPLLNNQSFYQILNMFTQQDNSYELNGASKEVSHIDTDKKIYISSHEILTPELKSKITLIAQETLGGLKLQIEKKKKEEN